MKLIFLQNLCNFTIHRESNKVILFSICFLKKIVFEFVQAASIDRHHVPVWQPASVMLTIVLVVIVVIM